MRTAEICIVLSGIFFWEPAVAEIGHRTFRCTPIEVYELTFDGLRMASPEAQKERTDGRDFIFEEDTGWKRELEGEKKSQYRVINSKNLVGSPVVAQYGELNPTFLKLLMSDTDDPSKFIYFQFGGGINVFGKCVAE